MNINAILYAEEAIILVAVRMLDLVGVLQHMETMRDVLEVAGRAARLLFVLPTFADARTRLWGEVKDPLARAFPHSLTSPIRIDVHLAEAARHGSGQRRPTCRASSPWPLADGRKLLSRD